MDSNPSPTETCRQLILTGVSGAGKSTLAGLLQASDRRFAQVVAVTTRPPRVDDRRWIYEYLSDDEFDSLERSLSLVVRAEYRGKRYGITRQHLAAVFRDRRIPMLLITPQSASIYLTQKAEVGSTRAEARVEVISVFVDAADAVLDERLNRRDGQFLAGPVYAQRALDRENAKFCSHLIANTDVDEALSAIRQLF